MNNDGKMDTEAGAQNLSTEEKLDNLARNMFAIIEKTKDMGLALDNIYIQVATLIEVLAAKPEILNPEIWENKLKEVTQNIKDTMEEIQNAQGNDGSNNVQDPDRPDASTGSGKIIKPNSGIIIPGQ